MIYAMEMTTLHIQNVHSSEKTWESVSVFINMTINIFWLNMQHVALSILLAMGYRQWSPAEQLENYATIYRL